jgi:hypothetical protein
MSTMKTPSELIFSYKPRILLDLVNKKVKNKEKQVRFAVDKEKSCKKQSYKNDNSLSVKNFKVGEKVMFQNVFKNVVKWIPARVIKQISALTYLVNVNNHVRFVHQDSLKDSVLEDDFHPSKFVENVEQAVKENVKQNVNDKETYVELRKSTRERRVPERLGMSKY